MSSKLTNKTCIVTGASSGMGKEAAINFAKEGGKVVLAARRKDKLNDVLEEIKAIGGEAIVVVGDVSKEEDCKRIVDAAMETYGGLHVAFNNAGIYREASCVDIEEDIMDAVLGANLKSVMFCLKYQIPAMSKTGDTGSIIVNSSCMADRTSVKFKRAGLYSASKAAVNMIVKYAAIEAGEDKVRVNSLAVGHVDTPLYGGATNEALTKLAGTSQVIGRPGKSEEVAKLVTYLASDDASMVTGSVMTMDGGWTLKA